MAIYIDFAIACRSLEKATKIETYFKTLPFIHDDLDDHAPYEDKNHIWWVSLIPKGIGLGVPYDSSYDCSRFSLRKSEIMTTLYEYLRKCADYELALLGWEVWDALVDKSEDRHLNFDGIQIPEYFASTEGLVVSEQIYCFIENKGIFQDFAPGYRWIPRTDSWNEFDPKT